MAKLDSIEGIGLRNVQLLNGAGVHSVENLLSLGRTPDGRRSLSVQAGVTSRRIFGWVKRADLARIKGVGGEYADLLEAAGINTVPDLSSQSPTELRELLNKVNKTKRLVKRVPSISRIEQWVNEAKRLPKLIDV